LCNLRLDIVMQIPLRSPDAVRRLVDRFDHIAPHWPHHKRLLALAAMYGYPSWETLVAGCSQSAPPLIYDQDLPSDVARQERWLAMAQQVAGALSLLLPEAINLINSVVPTMRMGVAQPPWYEPNDVFDQALQEDSDVWWICASHLGHPLVPPGFELSQAIRVSEVAHYRLANKYQPGVLKQEKLWILEPPQTERRLTYPHTYCRRRELIVIEPIPLADMLQAPRKMATLTQSFLTEESPTWTNEIRKQKLAEWLAALKALKVAAGLPASSKKSGFQTTVSARKAVGHNWHWPLRIVDSDPSAIEIGRSEAERVDNVICAHFGGDPGYIVPNY